MADPHGEPPTEEVDTRRVRTLTEKGKDVYTERVQKHVTKLLGLSKCLDIAFENFKTSPKKQTSLIAARDKVADVFGRYKDENTALCDYLNWTNTVDSDSELASRKVIFESLQDKVCLVLKDIHSQLKDISVKSLKSQSRTSRTSNSSSKLSHRLAKAEAAKTNLDFERKEAELKKEIARVEEQEAVTKAITERKKKYLDTDIQILSKERDVAVAEAELKVFMSDDGDSKASSISVPKADVGARTGEYVLNQIRNNEQEHKYNSDDEQWPASKYVPTPRPVRVLPASKATANLNFDHDEVNVELECGNEGVDTPKMPRSNLNPESPVFAPRHTEANIYSSPDQGAIFKFLMRKELTLSRLNKYDDKPETYRAWKVSFRRIMSELDVNPAEELDLLVKWLGPDSSKHAVSARMTNAHDPTEGLRRLWDRLDQRYGTPEMVEAALKNKLAKFPRLTNKDSARLYELTDILSEIDSTMQDPKYQSVLSHFNSSSGVIPIVNKLPYSLQSKWTSRGTRYKKVHGVAFPPFSEFCEFVREMSLTLNDPGFMYYGEVAQHGCREKPSPHQQESRRTNNVVVRKSQVGDTESKTSEVKQLCPLHNTRHSLNECFGFRRKSLTERKRFIGENNICFKCCETTSHKFKTCTASVACGDCGSDRHPSALHPQRQSFPSSQQYGGERGDNTGVLNKCTKVCGEKFSGRSCSKTLLVKVHPTGEPDRERVMYVILDDQSNRTLGRPEFFDAMDIPADTTEHYTLVSCAGDISTQGRCTRGFTISAMDGSFSIALPSILECDQIPNSRVEIPTPEITAYHDHLRDIPIPPLHPECEILLLVGRDLPEAHHVFEQCIGPMNSPFAQRLSLGWVIVGNVCLGETHKPEYVNVFKTSVLNNGRATHFEPCNSKFIVKDHVDRTPDFGTDVFRQTENDNKHGLSVEDKVFIELMDKGLSKGPEGTWIAPLPFRDPRPRLPNNRPLALKRALILDTNLRRNPLKREHLLTFMKGIMDCGHAEVAPPLAAGEECWYVPLFGVYHPKKPDKIRGVFDASAKYEGIALNDVLLKGPDFTNSLLGVLLRFRKEEVAINADIEQMFYCFSVKEDHRNFLRFMWYENNDPNKTLIEYRMCKHIFGNSPSPAVANYGLRRTVAECEMEFGSDVKEFVDRDFYVDDGITSVPTPTKAVSLLKRTQDALSTAGIRLHKISSNCQEVLDAFPPSDIAHDLKDLDLGSDDIPIQRSLGLFWDLQSDSFGFRASEQTRPYTHRGVLQ